MLKNSLYIFLFSIALSSSAQNNYLKKHIDDLKTSLHVLNFMNDSIIVNVQLFGKELDSIEIEQQYRFKNGMIEKNSYTASLYDFKDDEFTSKDISLEFYKNKVTHHYSEYDGEVNQIKIVSTMQFYNTKNTKELKVLKRHLYEIRKENMKQRMILKHEYENRY